MKNLNWLSDLNSKVTAALAVASFLFSLSAHSVTFQVSTSDEFQAALTTAASNGGDDEIVLAAGTYPGNFKFISEESAALVIRAADGLSEGEVVLDGEYRAFVLRFDAREYAVDLSIKGLTVTRGKSDTPGGGLSLKGRGGDLLIENVVARNNFAIQNAGISASNWRLAVVRNSIFEENGKYKNPSSPNSGPGSYGAGHLSVGAERAAVHANQFLALSANFDPTTMQSSFDPQFGQALQVSASGALGVSFGSELTCEDERAAQLSITSNVFEGLGKAQSEGLLLPVIRELVDARADCLTFSENLIRNVDIQYSLLSMNSVAMDFTSNTFQGVKVGYEAGVSADYVASVLAETETGFDFSGNSFEKIAVADQAFFTGQTPFLRLSGPIRFTGNSLIEAPVGIEIIGTGAVGAVIQDNVIVGVASGCSLQISGNQLEVSNNSISRGGNGSGLCFSLTDDSELVVANNIVWPTFSEGAGLDIDRIGYGLRSSLRNNIFRTASELWDVEEGNLTIDPSFFDVENGDLHVNADSPAINAGSNEATVGNDSDLDGNPRVLDGTVDIGAYERNTTDLHPADTNGDSVISSAEFEAYNTAWRANDVWPTAPAIITADFVTRAGYLLQKGGAYKNIGVGKPATWVPADE